MAYVFVRLKLVDQNPAIPDDLTFYRNRIYREVGKDTLRLDICHAKELKQTAPLLIFIYGEAWKRGDKDNYTGYLIDFAKQGYVTVSLNYRNSKVAPFPAALMDVKYAVKWLKSNAAKYHINPDKVALIGGSSGGYLAMMAGYSKCISKFDDDSFPDSIISDVQLVVDLYGPPDLTNEEVIETTSADRFIGKPFSTNPEAYKEASPITYISNGNPPTLIFHGTIDDVVPVEESDILKQKLEANGVKVEYHRLKGWPHFMEAGKKINNYSQYYMNRFFNKYFKDK
jgi:acetyl esterase/lipase